MTNQQHIRDAANAAAQASAPIAGTVSAWQNRWLDLKKQAQQLCTLIDRAPAAADAPVETALAKDAWNWLKENPRTLRNAILEIDDRLDDLSELPRSQCGEAEAGACPRVIAIAQAMLPALQFAWSEEDFSLFLQTYQAARPLQSAEIWAMPAALKFAILREAVPAAERLLLGNAADQDLARVPSLMTALQALGVAAFTQLLEPLLPVETVLQRDPAYARMDAASRQRYRSVVATLARRSAVDELQIAHTALALAQAESQAATLGTKRMEKKSVIPSERTARVEEPAALFGADRSTARRSHVGYFLIAEGRTHLLRRINYHSSPSDRIRDFLSLHAADAYISSTWIITLLLIAFLIVPVLGYTHVLFGLAIAFALTIIPASQAAVEIVNHLVTTLFPAEALPKLDFSRGLPAECATLVTVPVLLFNESQTRTAIDEIEVRYLANQDSHLHFALLTDLPDTADEPSESEAHPLVDLARNLIADLNRRYAGTGGGAFFLLHRHRVFNRHQGVWMGWERKRGKLLDLNRLLRGEYDSFPVKEGPVALLPAINYVLTLDADTALPRGAARQLLGAIAHPLNRAIIDPQRRVVVEGYGILQPRVGISVHSAASSRLANIYSGETGLDIYSRAVSDVYQDLFHEAIFTGKGLYEVDALRTVLEHRFSNNALLSHDLIEGAYARVGLVSDVEVIDDYPSHLRAWSKRKHRWMRGDWQITQWLFPRVSEEFKDHVPNPISLISRWKIFDNLRRSLVQPATFLLLVAGWLRLPGGPRYWTVATLALLFLPIYIHFATALPRIALRPKRGALTDALEAFFTAHITVLLGIVFLLHQAMLALDAIVRTMVRRFVTGKKLLEWETAAQAEHGRNIRTPVEMYLHFLPLIAAALAGLVALVNPASLPFALPLLALWTSGQLAAWWLDRPFLSPEASLPPASTAYLRRLALLTWRYFAEFSTARENWLVPDNVEEKDLRIAARVSPTNLGLLLNARQAAQRLGYLTLPEFAELSSATLASLERMERFRGHLLNWYDTRTLAPLSPRIVSSVDSGNLLASLITLAQGCRALLHGPLLPLSLHHGLLEIEREAQTGDDTWWQTEFASRQHALQNLTQTYLPWLLPEFAETLQTIAPNAPSAETLTLGSALPFLRDLDARLNNAWASMPEDSPVHEQIGPLRGRLSIAKNNLEHLRHQLDEISLRATRLADAMDFTLLLHPVRKLLSIAYNVEKNRIEEACYDLLASEARTAVFLAIAKGEAPQESWFNLGRAHVPGHHPPILISWTGTMFEYLMPNLWMRSSRGSLLDRTQRAAVKAQQKHVQARHIPWGISEAGYAAPGAGGEYQYHAFGLPELAVSPNARDGGPVIAPYACCLALPVDAPAAVKNLRAMETLGWLTTRGFYESAEYSGALQTAETPELVRSWMAHHQGITLLALLNVLEADAAKQWFHADKRVQSAALLLEERPMKASAIPTLRYTGQSARKQRHPA
jgi:cyclic beta-1,2-glucan synthetase